MQNKNFNFFFVCFILVVTLFTQEYSFGQSTSTSPYSSFGIGQRDGLDHSIYAGLGNTAITYFDSTTLNYFNPASYSTIGKGQPIFSTGISSRMSFYKEQDLNSFSKMIVVNHFALGLSFAKHLGLSFGLKPFSRKGYEFSQRQILVSDTVLNQYSGYGSSNEVFMGFSTNLLKLKNHHLAVGGNVGYVFGSMFNERKSNITTTTFGGVDQNLLKINALHYELGMFYKQQFNNKHSYSISAVVEPQQNLNAYQQWRLYTALGVNDPDSYNLIDSTNFVQGTISIPLSTTLGINYNWSFTDNKTDGQTRHSEISIHSSLNITNWGNFQTVFGTDTINPGYVSTNKFTIGFQYIPETSFLAQKAKSGFMEKARYRVGYYQYTLPIQTNGSNDLDRGGSIGIGLPISAQRSLSSLNFGLTYGKRSNGVPGSLSETYFGINVGVIFAPGSFERWFIKRKYD